MKISLLVPTRNRPQAMERLWKSALEMADEPNNLEIVFYMDNDDRLSLEQFKKMDAEDAQGRILGILGERIVLSQMWNECQKIATGEVFQHCGDDIVFRTKSWDTFVREGINKYPDKIVFVHGRDGIQDERLGTHGFLHKNWVNTLGYFVPPFFSCDFNDTWLTDVSSTIGRKIFEPRIYTEHLHWAVGKQAKDSTYSETQARGVRDNVQALYDNLLPKREEDAQKLLTFIEQFNKSHEPQNSI